ncbi:hypothetical protein ACES2L_04855 [Bdellovibrio bacteriovorus]
MAQWLLVLLFLFSATPSYSQLPRPLPDNPSEGDPYPPAPPAPAPRPPDDKTRPKERYSYSLGEGDTGRFKARRNVFYTRPDFNQVTQIRIVGLRNNIDIKQVFVHYADYSAVVPDEVLPGELKEGYTRVAVFNGRPVHSIEVVASASKFWKKLGNFRVDIVVEK